MKRVYDEELINRAISGSMYGEVLRTMGVPVFLVSYERGESVVSPYQENRYFQIVSEGSFSIYAIRNDGTRYGLSCGAKDYILGDMEIFVSNENSIFATAESELTAIAIDAQKYREVLLSNNAFLRLLLENMARKLEAITSSDVSPITLKERVLNYMEYKCDGGVLKGVERASSFLHCSSRQLQRILNEMETEGTVEKIGKGSYRLSK